MAFLQKLRLANIFPRNTAREDPYAMPDMNAGDDFINRALTAGRSAELGRENRMNSLRAAQDTLNPRMRPSVNRLKMIGDQLGINKPENVRFGGDIGFTPSQQTFMADRAIRDEEQRGIRAEERGIAREDNLAAQKRRDDELAFNRSLLTGSIEDETARELADLEFQRAQETGKTEFERRRQLAREDDERAAAAARIAAQDRERLARVTAEETRRTNAARPITPSQQGNSFENRVQQLTIENPEAAKLLEFDQNTGTYSISRRATPEQHQWIRNYLSGGSQSPTTSRSIYRVSKKDPSRKQVSTDGGKTWKDVSNGSSK